MGGCKMCHKERLHKGRGLDTSESTERPMAGSSEYFQGHFTSTKGEEFLDQLNDYQRLKLSTTQLNNLNNSVQFFVFI
jgi:hypothetical protein